MQKNIRNFGGLSTRQALLSPLAIASILLCANYSHGFASLSIAHTVGFVIIGFIGGVSLTLSLRIFLHFSLSKQGGIILICISGIYLLMSLIAPSITYSYCFLIVISISLTLVILLDLYKNDHIFKSEKVALFVLTSLSYLSIWIAFWTMFGHFSPDSYSYYDISRTLTEGGILNYGNINHIRQYVIDTQLSVSFPYLFPLLVALIDFTTGLGVYSGVFINIYILILTNIMLICLSKKMSGTLWCGAFAFLALSTSFFYLDEVCAGRSIPLAILLTLFVIFCLVTYFADKTFRHRYIFLAGSAAGAVSCVRFDGIALVLFCFLVIFITSKGRRIKNIAFFLSGALIVMTPWILYSLINFGKPWISDNSGTAFLVETVGPTRITIEGTDSLRTLFDAPQEWIQALAGKAETVFGSLLACSYVGDWMVILCVLGIILFSKYLYPLDKSQLFFIVCIFIYYSLKTLAYILVGYGDARYHSETVCLVAFCAALLLQWTARKRAIKWLSVSTLALALISCTIQAPKLSYSCRNAQSYPFSQVVCPPIWVSQLEKALVKASISENDSLMIAGDSFAFSAWTNYFVYATPTPLNIETLKHTLDRYKIDYLIVPIASQTEKDLGGILKDTFPTTYLSEKWIAYHLTSSSKTIED